MHQRARLFWEIFLVANVVIIIGYWWNGSGAALMAGGSETVIALGRLLGLLAAGLVLVQFAFMGRNPYLERAFGLDKLSRIHHQTGQWGLLLLLAHPILLTVGYSSLTGTSVWRQFLMFILQYEYVWLAALALLLFVIVVGLSLTIVRRKLRYESWYFVHLLVYLAVFGSFWHQIKIGPDFQVSQAFYWYWIVLYSVVFGSHFVFRFLRPLYLFHRHHFRVDRIERETHNAVSIYITGRRLSEFTIYPGQFMIFRFLTRDLWWQAHPFSLSMMPNGQELRITVKEVGDFTRQVREIPVGAPVIIDGPYGVFTQWVSVAPKVLFIAGGIGITPIRSLMENMLQAGKSAILLYGNQTQKDIVFDGELDLLEEQHGGTVVDVLSNETTFDGERGFIDAEKIQRLVPDVMERDVYLCGPVPMMKAVRGALLQLGVPRQQIHWERFAL